MELTEQQKERILEIVGKFYDDHVLTPMKSQDPLGMGFEAMDVSLNLAADLTDVVDPGNNPFGDSGNFSDDEDEAPVP